MNNAAETKIPRPLTARKFNLQEKMNLGSNASLFKAIQVSASSPLVPLF